MKLSFTRSVLALRPSSTAPATTPRGPLTSWRTPTAGDSRSGLCRSSSSGSSSSRRRSEGRSGRELKSEERNQVYYCSWLNFVNFRSGKHQVHTRSQSLGTPQPQQQQQWLAYAPQQHQEADPAVARLREPYFKFECVDRSYKPVFHEFARRFPRLSFEGRAGTSPFYRSVWRLLFKITFLL